jgi:single-strand DNA-binding protein
MSQPLVWATGGVVADPEVRVTDAGKAWARTRIACQERVRDGAGGWTDGETTYLTVVAFGRQAENLVESVRKGDLISVQGRLQQREYEQDGVTRTEYSVRADEVAVSVGRNPAKTPRALEDSGDTEPPF